MTDTMGSNNPGEHPQMSPDWLRGLLMPRVSRRMALQAGGASALALALSACGVAGVKAAQSTPSSPSAPAPTSVAGGATSAADAGSSSSSAATTSTTADVNAAYWAAQTKTGEFNFANWPLYIDVNPNNKNDHPSIDLFTQQTGIKVNYSEVIQDDAPFFGKIRPQLAAGQYCGYDLMVITNGIYLTLLIELGYLTPLDQSKMTNFYANASSAVKNPSFDPGNVHSMAWQSGITGIGYNPKLVGRKITSWQDLLDPKFKGKIGMFADNEDLPNAALCAIGVDPATSTQADWQKAVAWLQKGKPLVRQYYHQDYIQPLSRGDIWVSMAWSGDIFQANASGANLEFVVPEEGAPIWTDNMCIAKGAEHPLDAMTYMDFVYEPKIAAMLAEAINYITPVRSAKTFIEADAAKATGSDKASLQQLASSPLIFPPQDELSRLHYYRVLTQAELKTWNAMFEPIYQS